MGTMALSDRPVWHLQWVAMLLILLKAHPGQP